MYFFFTLYYNIWSLRLMIQFNTGDACSMIRFILNKIQLNQKKKIECKFVKSFLKEKHVFL